MPSPSINLIKSSDGTGNAAMATVQSTRAPLASTIIVDTVDNIPATFYGSMGTPHTFVDPITAETITVISEATSRDFEGHVDGTNLEIDAMAPGNTDLGSSAGDVIIIKPTTEWANNVAEILDVAHADNGKLSPTAPIDSVTTPTLNLITPVATVVDYAGTTAPTGWLLCYGQALDASATPAYQDLYDVIGNTFGGTNNTNFVVPDLRGRVVAGQDDMGGSSANRLTAPASTTGGINGDTLGATGGAETHVLTTAQLAAHTHPQQTTTVSGGGLTRRIDDDGITGSAQELNQAASTLATGSDAAHNNVQPTIILNKIIKY